MHRAMLKLWFTLGVMLLLRESLAYDSLEDILENDANAENIYRAYSIRGDPIEWSRPDSWERGATPNSDSVVIVPEDVHLLLDIDTVNVEGIFVQGTLEVVDDHDVDISSNYIMVHGTFQLGLEYQPFKHKATITLKGGSSNQDSIHGMGTKVLSAMAMDEWCDNHEGCTHKAQLDIHGVSPSHTWTRLLDTAPQGATKIVVADAVNWKVGDEIAIAPTGFRLANAEKRTITWIERKIHQSLAEIQFDEPLEWNHITLSYAPPSLPRPELPQTVEQAAEVALLSRNIVIQGDALSDSKVFGAHTMVHGTAEGRFTAVEFRRVGQKGRMGRYPVHFHLHGDGSASFVRDCAIHRTYNRAITLHGVHGLAVQNNVAFDVTGHAVFIEDGVETENVIEHNLVMKTAPMKGWVETPLLVSDNKAACFFIRHPTNHFRDNVAAGCGTGYWFLPPVHPDGPSRDSTIWPRKAEIGTFMGNTAHSTEFDCITVENYSPEETQTIQYGNLWMCGGAAIGVVHTTAAPNIHFTKMTISDIGHVGVNAQYSGGEVVLRHSLIVGESPNDGDPSDCGEMNKVDGQWRCISSKRVDADPILTENDNLCLVPFISSDGEKHYWCTSDGDWRPWCITEEGKKEYCAYEPFDPDSENPGPKPVVVSGVPQRETPGGMGEMDISRLKPMAGVWFGLGPMTVRDNMFANFFERESKPSSALGMREPSWNNGMIGKMERNSFIDCVFVDANEVYFPSAINLDGGFDNQACEHSPMIEDVSKTLAVDPRANANFLVGPNPGIADPQRCSFVEKWNSYSCETVNIAQVQFTIDEYGTSKFFLSVVPYPSSQGITQFSSATPIAKLYEGGDFRILLSSNDGGRPLDNMEYLKVMPNVLQSSVRLRVEVDTDLDLEYKEHGSGRNGNVDKVNCNGSTVRDISAVPTPYYDCETELLVLDVTPSGGVIEFIVPCSGHGRVDNHSHKRKCVCDDGFTGDSCEVECNGHGRVNQRGLCECLPGFQGHTCEMEECSGNGVHFRVGDNTVCKCNAGWSGELCDFEQEVTCDHTFEGGCWVLEYDLALTDYGGWTEGSPPDYDVDNTAMHVGQKFSRVAYLLELGSEQVWVSWKTQTQDRSRIGVPYNTKFDMVVEEFTVRSNSDKVQPITMDVGTIQFFPCGYGGTYDSKDQDICVIDFGSMQAFGPEGETVFAFNGWANVWILNDIGIGANVNGNKDWTFAANAHTFTTKRLRVFTHMNSDESISCSSTEIPSFETQRVVASCPKGSSIDRIINAHVIRDGYFPDCECEDTVMCPGRNDHNDNASYCVEADNCIGKESCDFIASRTVCDYSSELDRDSKRLFLQIGCAEDGALRECDEAVDLETIHVGCAGDRYIESVERADYHPHLLVHDVLDNNWENRIHQSTCAVDNWSEDPYDCHQWCPQASHCIGERECAFIVGENSCGKKPDNCNFGGVLQNNDNNKLVLRVNCVDEPTDYPSSAFASCSRSTASRVTGPPNSSGKCRNSDSSWVLSGAYGTTESIVAEFKSPLFVTRLEVVETHSTGHIVRVMFYDEGNKEWIEEWAGIDSTTDCPGTFAVNKDEFIWSRGETPYPVSKVWIEVLGGDNVGIDSVALRGRKAARDNPDCSNRGVLVGDVCDCSSQYGGPGCEWENLALYRPVEASTISDANWSTKSEYANDGDVDTVWYLPGTHQSSLINLGQASLVRQIVIYPSQYFSYGGGNLNLYDANMIGVGSDRFDFDGTTVLPFDFEAGGVVFVELVMDGEEGGYAGVSDIAVYGTRCGDGEVFLDWGATSCSPCTHGLSPGPHADECVAVPSELGPFGSALRISQNDNRPDELLYVDGLYVPQRILSSGEYHFPLRLTFDSEYLPDFPSYVTTSLSAGTPTKVWIDHELQVETYDTAWTSGTNTEYFPSTQAHRVTIETTLDSPSSLPFEFELCIDRDCENSKVPLSNFFAPGGCSSDEDCVHGDCNDGICMCHPGYCRSTEENGACTNYLIPNGLIWTCADL